VIQVAEEERGGRVDSAEVDLRVGPVEDADLGGKVSLGYFFSYINFGISLG
jgi:hypothetical protein